LLFKTIRGSTDEARRAGMKPAVELGRRHAEGTRWSRASVLQMVLKQGLMLVLIGLVRADWRAGCSRDRSAAPTTDTGAADNVIPHCRLAICIADWRLSGHSTM
jgi:hypothetical protein